MQARNNPKKISRALVRILENTSEKEAEEKVRRFKKILRKWGMTKETYKILKEFSKDWKEKDGTIATVVSSEPLPREIKNWMEKKLTDKKYLLEEKTDKEIIGGLALFLGNEYLIDGTIKGKLKKMQKIMSF